MIVVIKHPSTSVILSTVRSLVVRYRDVYLGWLSFFFRQRLKVTVDGNEAL